MVSAAQKVDQQIKKQKDSKGGRLMTVLEKNGGYNSHVHL